VLAQFRQKVLKSDVSVKKEEKGTAPLLLQDRRCSYAEK